MKNNLFRYRMLLLSVVIALNFLPSPTLAKEHFSGTEKTTFYGKHPVNPLDPSEKVNPVNTPSQKRDPEISNRRIPLIKKHIKPDNLQKLPIQKKDKSFLKKKKFNSKFSFVPLNKETIPTYIMNSSSGFPPSSIPSTNFGQVLSAISGTLIFGIKKNPVIKNSMNESI